MSSTPVSTVRSDTKSLVYVVCGVNWPDLLASALMEAWPTEATGHETEVARTRSRMRKILGPYGLIHGAKQNQVAETVCALMRAGMPVLLKIQFNADRPSVVESKYEFDVEDPFFTPANALTNGLRQIKATGNRGIFPDYVLYGALSLALCRLAVDVSVSESVINELDAAELLIGSTEAGDLAREYARNKVRASKSRQPRHPELNKAITEYAVGPETEFGSLTAGKAALAIATRCPALVSKTYPCKDIEDAIELVARQIRRRRNQAQDK